MARMEEVNAAEDTEHGEDDDGSGGLPAELQSRERRRATLRAVRAQLAQEKGEQLEPRHQKSFADPDAQMMRTGDGAQGRDGLAALHAARGGEGARGVGSRVRGLQPAAAARNRSRLRLTRAGEAAPPARGAEERSGEAGAPSERL